MSKYLKVMLGTKSSASDFEYKLGEVNVAKIWNPKELILKKMGGFNFSTESKILRWLVRGDTIYDVELPEDAEVVDRLAIQRHIVYLEVIKLLSIIQEQ